MRMAQHVAAWAKSAGPDNPYIASGCICWYDKIETPDDNPVNVFAGYLDEITRARQNRSITIQISVDGTINSSAFDFLQTAGDGGNGGRVDLSSNKMLVYCGDSFGTYINYQRANHSFIALTINGETWKAYVSDTEGQLKTVSRNAVIPYSSTVHGIRFKVATPNQMVVYDRAMTDAEIAANYAIDKARFDLT